MFTAVQIFDTYLEAKRRKNKKVGQEHLYLIGMTIVLTSSKFEDVQPILMKTLTEKAGLNRFSVQQVV
jgi:hypothetical protein